MVGGAVRNELLDEPVRDIDVATTALPDEVMRRAAAAGFKPVPTGDRPWHRDRRGRRHAVRGDDVARGRRDLRAARPVAFGRDWRRDAERRDFTMNALSVTRDGTVHDYVGGLDDLAERRVRFIGDPATSDRRGLSAHPAVLPLPCRL